MRNLYNQLQQKAKEVKQEVFRVQVLKTGLGSVLVKESKNDWSFTYTNFPTQTMAEAYIVKRYPTFLKVKNGKVYEYLANLDITMN